MHDTYGCWQLHLVWLANHSGLVQKAAGGLEPGQAQYGWWQRAWTRLGWVVLLPKTMPAKDTEDNAKATEMTNKTPAQGHRSPGLQTCILLDCSIRVRQIPPVDCSSWSTGSLCEWIYVRPGFQVRSLCVILGLSLSHTHDIWLAINSTSRSSWVSCSAPSLKCYSISPACLTHLPVSTIARVTHSPQACQSLLSRIPNTLHQFLAAWRPSLHA